MTSVDVHKPGGGTDGTVDLPAEIFDVQVNIPLIHQVVVAQLAAARQGTSSTKTRGASLTSKREPAAPVRDRPVRPSSLAVEPFTVRHRAATNSAPPRR